MKRSILTIIVLMLVLSAFVLAGCTKPHYTEPTGTAKPTEPLSTSTAAPTTTAPTLPEGFIQVHMLTKMVYTDESTGESITYSVVYDDAGRVVEVSNGSEVLLAYTYDEHGNCVSYQNAILGIDQTYDAQGNILTDRQEDILYTNTYDESGRCVCVESHYVDGTFLSAYRYTYDENGLLISEISELDGVVEFEILHTYDDQGRHLTQVYYCDGQISPDYPYYEWKYDENGFLESDACIYADGYSIRTLYYFDSKAQESLPNLRWDSDGNMYQYSYFYDAQGNLKRYVERFTDSEKNQYQTYMEYEYDGHDNAILQKIVDYSGEETIYRWSYDETGLILLSSSYESSDYAFEYHFVFDARGKKVQQIRTGDDPYELVFTYNEFGILLGSTYKTEGANANVSYAYSTVIVTQEVASQLQAWQRELFLFINDNVLPFD